MDQMNVRLHRGVSDIDGVTGMAIMRAIAEGERDPKRLARLRDRHCRKSEGEIAEPLTGHWREDHVLSAAESEEEEEEQREHAGCRPTEYGRALAAQ